MRHGPRAGLDRHVRTPLPAPPLKEGLLRTRVRRAGREPRDAFERIHLVCAFTERQQIEAVDHIEGILKRGGVRLVSVQQVAKLFAGPPLVSRATRETLGGMVPRLVQLCAEAGAPVVASASPP